MNLGELLSKESLVLGSLWKLKVHFNGYKNEISEELATQVSAGRSFQLIKIGQNLLEINQNIKRVKVRLLEDGYFCWFELSNLLGNAERISSWSPKLLNKQQIQNRIPLILNWIENASKHSKRYLWGGTIGPDYDCSGLVQAAFSHVGIWLPRDAYQQENFCTKLNYSQIGSHELRPGDLFFFGNTEKCNHVGIHIDNGFYWHSSGIINGRNGIGIDGLLHRPSSLIGRYYKSQFRSARRVFSCYDIRRF